MAVPAPASVTVGDVIRGSEVNITWSAVPDVVSYRVQRSVNGMSFGDEIINNTTLTSMTDVAGENWNTVQYRVQAMAYAGAMLGYSDWTTSPVINVDQSSAEDPPTPGTGTWSLEQFQNSAGEDIYPRTILEGIFCKSNGKSLLEVLEEIETTPGPPGLAGKDGGTGAAGPAGPGVSAGGTAGQVLTKNSSTNYDTQWKTLVSYGTGDLTAGSSSLATGQIHLVYE